MCCTSYNVDDVMYSKHAYASSSSLLVTVMIVHVH